ncbi:MAG: ABC transporter substrate-binding protein [Thermoleophilia bacterium]|nr:ABC transporter substrate-binding protein [Thermoleophilia bacterium]
MSSVNDEKREDEGLGGAVDGSVSRRQFLKWVGATGAAVSLGGVLAGCGGDEETTTTAGGTETTAPGATTSVSVGETMGREIKVGWVTMTTGVLASLSEPDDFLLAQAKTAVGEGLVINGTRHPVSWIVKDSQSDSNRAAEVAGDLITGDQVDLMMTGMTPIVCNPVADQCEANGVPLISYGAPWQAWFFGRGGDPAVGFDWTYHFFWGAEDMIAVYTSLWNKVETNKKVGVLWPNDPDGQAMADPTNGFPQRCRSRASRSSTPAATRTAPRTSRASSRSSSPRTARSSPG